ncbi:MAG: ATP synthase F1 subunit delta [Candidatus Firestonebacteria bacterium]
MAKKYGRALFEAAVSGGEAKLETIKNGLDLASERLSPAALQLLLSPTMSRAEKDGMLKDAGGVGAAQELLNFFYLLIDKKRMNVFKEAHGEFFSLYERHKGILRAEARSAAPLDEKQRERIVKTLEKRYSAKFIISYFTDPGLLGGLTIKIGNDIIDDSIRNRLNEIRNSLLK